MAAAGAPQTAEELHEQLTRLVPDSTCVPRNERNKTVLLGGADTVVQKMALPARVRDNACRAAYPHLQTLLVRNQAPFLRHEQLPIWTCV